MRLPSTKCAISLTSCWERCDETAFHKMYNFNHLLLIIGKDVMRLTIANVQCHSQAIGHRKRCDETAFHKMCHVTDFLLAIGKDVMRLPFKKNLQCCSHPVSSKKKIHRTAHQKYLPCYSHTVDHSRQILMGSPFEPLNQHDMLLTFYVYG